MYFTCSSVSHFFSVILFVSLWHLFTLIHVNAFFIWARPLCKLSSIRLSKVNSFIHSFRPFLQRLFKSSTTQRHSRLQHGYCIGVSRRSANILRNLSPR